jgi:5'-3' exonuclease
MITEFTKLKSRTKKSAKATNNVPVERKPLLMLIDGMNFAHRAKAGFLLGEFPVVFNFFRNLRALIEMHQPTKVVFVLEGHPKRRYELLEEYKANRRDEPEEGVEPTEEQVKKALEKKEFYRQCNIMFDLLQRKFPISVVRQSDYECDDTIYNIILSESTVTPTIPVLVVSNDSDFTQLHDEFNHVRIYNPITKTFVESAPVDYVIWKSLRGDGSDNIPGLPGIGDKTADVLANDVDKLKKFLEDPALEKTFLRNYQLIKFPVWSIVEKQQMTSTVPERDWQEVQDAFSQYEFKSLLKETTWEKFTSTFEHLWYSTPNVGN